MSKPNIVIFNVDQMRRDSLAHMGNPASVTPTMDELCQTDAVSFRNAFCQNPVCTPSRCSFMSGWYPHTAGHRTMVNMMKEDEPVLLKELKDEGYFVFWAGKNDLIPSDCDMRKFCDVRISIKDKKAEVKPSSHSDMSWRAEKNSPLYYSLYEGKREKGDYEFVHADHLYVNEALNFIQNRPSDQPFCIYLSLEYPHPPYGVEEPYFSLIDRRQLKPRIPVPDWRKKPSILKGIYDNQGLMGMTEAQWAELRAVYLGMCSRVDAQLGQLINALKQQSLYDDTAIFIFSDHGDFTGDYGLVEKTQNTFEDCLTNVPLIIKPPKNIAVKSRISDALVELVDFYATVEALCDLPKTHTHFGKSLIPLLKEEIPHREYVCCEGGRRYGEREAMELSLKSTRDPQNLYNPRVRLQIMEAPYHTKAVMLRNKRYKYVYRHYETDELYDLQQDPKELNNIIDEPSMREIVLNMKEQLLSFMIETCDVVPLKQDRR
ncbi:MAG: sulfatase-like hydrolase/transferase [Clostridia bacterium]|nr:sulfatase-like hydrolase/transferase [Clostridia bacterium]